MKLVLAWLVEFLDATNSTTELNLGFGPPFPSPQRSAPLSRGQFRKARNLA